MIILLLFLIALPTILTLMCLGVIGAGATVYVVKESMKEKDTTPKG